ncbi:N-6 DNA methylase [Sphingobium lignivorans]|uniref:site-specific DNA-methyltransferase (adenine-specific) n=1 Tax=Sphingobium lignivorans TaxID=2735886 RepID=A0ABR6NCW7_9SPHN|nr:N-6 DNA methylase [Sphingobium lignivorans]MBB5984517.1 SAM-dependent methyltransferase [Sphingobium lignivorans]
MIELIERLLQRESQRTEADIQADIRQFILMAPFDLNDNQVVNLESPVGDRRRIDIEVGSTVIEVKRDLRRGRVRIDAAEQLAGYVAARREQTGQRYIGVLTDGIDWTCYDLVDGSTLRPVAQFTLQSTADLDRLVVWVEGVLATTHAITPTSTAIVTRLGAGSSAYALDRATLGALYARNRDLPTVRMKRELWSRLLTSALGTQFEDTDDLFIEHTLLVNSAEIIAHAVLGLSVQSIPPAALLSGQRFDEAGIYGVVEPDFFDWVVEVDQGEVFIRTLARRLARFDWSNVEQDVLKVLYESIIGADTRKRLGEYYTPDWLAQAVVSETLRAPLSTRVLDPACGSGTFLFHAIRTYIAAAEAAGNSLPELLAGVTQNVIGMDLHPVAVTLARVTYLLALGRARIVDPNRCTIQIPVYLGDSLQWREQNTDLWSAGNLVIQADDSRELFTSDLRFPSTLLDDAGRFDQLVNDLARRASSRNPGAPVPSLSATFQRLGIAQEDRATIEATFRTMCRLHDEGRDHIWGYYVRNLARPMWLSREGNKVDLIIGNPPWLALRFMTPGMQTTFRNMSTARGLWAGAELATQQDLAGLFVVRSCELYLRRNGRFAMVLPNAALDRPNYDGFRTGAYGDGAGGLQIAFQPSWDLRRLRPHFFPRAACVIFGERAEEAVPMPLEASIWRGQIVDRSAPWDEISALLERTEGSVRRLAGACRSPYHAMFTQGAVLLPRLAFMVERQQANPLGLPAGSAAVISHRSNNEKKPWKQLDSLTGIVETDFLRPVHTGETLLPFRMLDALEGVLPCNQQGLLSEPEGIDMFPGLSRWWSQANDLWLEHRSSEKLTLMEQLDYQSKMTKQLPVAALRVVYNRSGMHVVGAKLEDRRAILTSGLYWMPAFSVAEADYLCALLNAPHTTELVRPLMSYGKDERDIAKHIWELPVPRFDTANETHVRLAALGAQLEQTVQAIECNEARHFAALRRDIRRIIETTDEGIEANELALELLG